MSVHPSAALFDDATEFPAIPACEHFAGAEKLIRKAFALQDDLGTVFDVTCDCEDGAAAGQERAHAQMVAALVASRADSTARVGVRIHDPSHPHWRADLDILLSGCGDALAYITVPKVASAAQADATIAEIRGTCADRGIARAIPLHVLIETHGALADAGAIAALPWVETLDFGLMDFVSAHHGAIPASAMRSPAQFEHRLLVRAKAEIAAAALRNGVVPSHNVCLDLKNPDAARSDAARARADFGFLRMWSIHPIQIMPIVEAMRPDTADVADAAAILLKAQAADWGPISHAGELHDRATYRYFWTVLRRAAAAGVPVGEAAQTAFFG